MLFSPAASCFLSLMTAPRSQSTEAYACGMVLLDCVSLWAMTLLTFEAVTSVNVPWKHNTSSLMGLNIHTDTSQADPMLSHQHYYMGWHKELGKFTGIYMLSTVWGMLHFKRYNIVLLSKKISNHIALCDICQLAEARSLPGLVSFTENFFLRRCIMF